MLTYTYNIYKVYCLSCIQAPSDIRCELYQHTKVKQLNFKRTKSSWRNMYRRWGMHVRWRSTLPFFWTPLFKYCRVTDLWCGSLTKTFVPHSNKWSARGEETNLRLVLNSFFWHDKALGFKKLTRIWYEFKFKNLQHMGTAAILESAKHHLNTESKDLSSKAISVTSNCTGGSEVPRLDTLPVYDLGAYLDVSRALPHLPSFDWIDHWAPAMTTVKRRILISARPAVEVFKAVIPRVVPCLYIACTARE